MLKPQSESRRPYGSSEPAVHRPTSWRMTRRSHTGSGLSQDLAAVTEFTQHWRHSFKKKTERFFDCTLKSWTRKRSTMAQTATIYNLNVDLSDVDRGVYETLNIRIARHPSETAEYMLVRVLAYCLEFRDGIALTEGVASADEPAILVRDLTGQITAWIEVGLPDASRIHRGSKLAARTAVYTHRGRQLLSQLEGAKVYKSESVPIYTLDPEFIDEVASLIDRRSSIGMSITEQQIYLTINGRDFTTSIEQHRIS